MTTWHMPTMMDNLYTILWFVRIEPNKMDSENASILSAMPKIISEIKIIDTPCIVYWGIYDIKTIYQ